MAVKKRTRQSRLNIRKSNPALYYKITTNAVGEILLAANFWWYTPTFNPYGVSKSLVSVVFLMLGATLLGFLHVLRDLRKVRVLLAVSIFCMLAWGAGNTQQVLDGRASWQLPIFIGLVGTWQVFLIAEAPVNPLTEKRQ